MQEITDESAKYKTHQGLNRKEEYPKQSQHKGPKPKTTNTNDNHNHESHKKTNTNPPISPTHLY